MLDQPNPFGRPAVANGGDPRLHGGDGREVIDGAADNRPLHRSKLRLIGRNHSDISRGPLHGSGLSGPAFGIRQVFAT